MMLRITHPGVRAPAMACGESRDLADAGSAQPPGSKVHSDIPTQGQGVSGLDVMVWYPGTQAMLGWMHWLMENA